MADGDDQFEQKPRKRQPDADDAEEAGIKKPSPPSPARRRPPERARDDDDDDDLPRRLRRESTPNDGGVGYVIPYRNGTALAAYYVGVFGVILCFLPPLSFFSGVAALVLGTLGVRRARQNPEAHGTAHAYVGIVLGLLQVLVACGVVGLFGYAALTGK